MVNNSSVSRDENQNVKVTAFKEVRCPACDKFLFEYNGKAEVRHCCMRCQAKVELRQNGEVKLIARPKKPQRIAPWIDMDP